MSRIAEITARRKAITAGEWRVKRIPNPFHSEDVVIQPVPRADVEQICELGTTEGENIMEDAAFIANAPGDIDYLLARVKAADEIVSEVATLMFTEDYTPAGITTNVRVFISRWVIEAAKAYKAVHDASE